MHIVTWGPLADFGREHADAMADLREWRRRMRRAHYTKPADVRADFPSVDFVGPHRAVFNICRNGYRLIADVRFDLGRVYVRHIVTHREYDRLSKKKLL